MSKDHQKLLSGKRENQTTNKSRLQKQNPYGKLIVLKTASVLLDKRINQKKKKKEKKWKKIHMVSTKRTTLKQNLEFGEKKRRLEDKVKQNLPRSKSQVNEK
jgi:hypothetical protein